MKKFLDYNADPNIIFREHHNQTTMSIVADNLNFCLPVIKMLLEYGFDCQGLINHLSGYKYYDYTQNVLMILCGKGKNSFECVKFLMEDSRVVKFINLHATNNFQENVLHEAYKAGNVEIVTYILDIWCKDRLPKNDVLSILNARNSRGHTPIFLSNSVQCVELAIKHGADLTIPSKEGFLLIHRVCQDNITAVLSYIIENKLYDLNVETKNELKQSPLNISIEYGSIECTDLLCKQEKVLVTKSDIEVCVMKNRLFVLKIILKMILNRNKGIDTWDSLQNMMDQSNIFQIAFMKQLIDKYGNNNTNNRCVKFLQDLLHYGFEAHDYHFISFVLNYNLRAVMSDTDAHVPNRTVRIRRAHNIRDTYHFMGIDGTIGDEKSATINTTINSKETEFETKSGGASNDGNDGISVSTTKQRHETRSKRKIEWQEIEKLGEGTFGKVTLAIDSQTGEKVALKRLKLGLRMDGQSAKVWSKFIDSEITPISMIYHPNIVNIIGYNLNVKNKHQVSIALEYAPFGDLKNLLKVCEYLEQDIAIYYLRQITSALKACHEKGIVHRDLKLGNILIGRDFQIKIADFGISKLLHHNETNLNSIERVGTLGYMAPELFMIVKGGLRDYSKIEQIQISSATDIFAIGIILWKMTNSAYSAPFEKFSKEKKCTTKEEFGKTYSMYSLIMNNSDTQSKNQFWLTHEEKPTPFFQFQAKNLDTMKMLFENMFEYDPLKRITISTVDQIVNEKLVFNGNVSVSDFQTKISNIYANSERYYQTIVKNWHSKDSIDETKDENKDDIQWKGIAHIQNFNETVDEKSSSTLTTTNNEDETQANTAHVEKTQNTSQEQTETETESGYSFLD